MLVKDVMTPAVGHVSPEESLRDAAERMKALNLSPMPVVEHGIVVGVLTEAILLDHVRTDGLAIGSHRVRDAMSREMACCSEDDSLYDVMNRVSKDHSARLPVVDAEGHLKGTVSIPDLRRGLESSSGETAIEDVESISQLVRYDEDPVDFMNDSSFPASDPIPPPSSVGPGEDT
jgi:CBS domain-containing protein